MDPLTSSHDQLAERPQAAAARVTTGCILAGVGIAARTELCTQIALLESIDSLEIADGAARSVGRSLGLLKDEHGARLDAEVSRLEASPLPDEVLRYRLWKLIATSLSIPPMPPLSLTSARRSAAAIALRASERLSPVYREVSSPSAEPSTWLGRRLESAKQTGREWLGTAPMLSFPELVEREMLQLLADEQVIEQVRSEADPEIRRSLDVAHRAAKLAAGAAGGWAAFAAVVGNAGFAPYILAAQASAFIPLVSGPGLVSLLAVLINPLTLMVGVAGLGWLALGRGAKIARSQIAARLSLLLAMRGSLNQAEGLARFIDDMRLLAGGSAVELEGLAEEGDGGPAERIRKVLRRLGSAPERSAGVPPEPWNIDAAAKFARRDRAIGDATLATGLTAGEMLWHAAAIDPNVLKAADFSRIADLGDPVSFALHAQDFAVRGADVALRGYFAERLVLDRLVAEGHDVEIASASNTPGFDLIVDGSPVQVKCGTSFSIIDEHFRKYPDIPVITNAALAEEAMESARPWADLVTTVPGFELEEIEKTIADALGHAGGLAGPHLLEFALAIGAFRGGLEVWRGRIPVEDVPAWLLIDGATRGVLSFGGAKVGGLVGLVAIGPAGALILGPVIGGAALIGSSWGREQITRVVMRDWLSGLIRLAEELRVSMQRASDKRIERLEARVEKLRNCVVDGGEMSDWMIRRAKDDLVAAIEERLELDGVISSEAEARALAMDAGVRFPSDVGVLKAMRRLLERLAAKPGLGEALRSQERKLRDWAWL